MTSVEAQPCHLVTWASQIWGKAQEYSYLTNVSGACLENKTKQRGKVPIAVSISAPCQLRVLQQLRVAVDADLSARLYRNNMHAFGLRTSYSWPRTI